MGLALILRDNKGQVYNFYSHKLPENMGLWALKGNLRK